MKKDKKVFKKKKRNITVHHDTLNVAATANLDIFSTINVVAKEEVKAELYKETEDGQEVILKTVTMPAFLNVSSRNEEYSEPVTTYEFFLDEWEWSTPL